MAIKFLSDLLLIFFFSDFTTFNGDLTCASLDRIPHPILCRWRREMDDHSSFLLLGNNFHVVVYCDDSHWKRKTRTTRKAHKVQCMSYISYFYCRCRRTKRWELSALMMIEGLFLLPASIQAQIIVKGIRGNEAATINTVRKKPLRHSCDFDCD